MCTLTWTWQADGYFVAFNRDERRTRALGLAPRRLEREGVRAIAPIDGEAGGTWIAVNEFGTTLALLNGYRFQLVGELAEEGARRWKSRGELVLATCDQRGAVQALERVASLDLQPFRAFELVAFDPSGDARVASWTGAALEVRTLTALDLPFVSSSFDDDVARRERRASYARSVGEDPGEAELARFHSSHEPARGPYSPCMHRDDAQTVSFTRVRVAPRSIELEYQPGSPCESAPTLRASLPRAAAGSRPAPAPWNSSKR